MESTREHLTESASVRRWVFTFASALALLLIAGIAVLAVTAPENLWIGLVPVVGIVALVAFVRRPDLGLIGLLASTVLLLQPDDGLKISEVAYLVFYATYLLTWYGSRLINGTRVVYSAADRAALVLVIAGCGIGALLGLFYRAPFESWQGEVIGFSTISLFLPVREFVRTHRRGPEAVGLIIIWFGLWITIRNALTAYTAITEATHIWQIADVRVANGDIVVYIATVVIFGAFACVQGRVLRLGLLVVGGLCFFGVLLAKSRGYWVDLALALMVLTVVVPSRDRRNLILNGFGGAFALAIPLILVAGPAATVVLIGAFRRLVTVETSLTADVSLINRFYETSAVWEKIKDSPLLGYGFGTPFYYHSILSQGRVSWSFVHNGFAGVWFKIGLWGLLTILFLWLVSSLSGIWAARYKEGLTRVERGLGLGAGTAALCLLPTFTTSNPFLLFDTLIVLTVAMALAHGVYQRSQGTSS